MKNNKKIVLFILYFIIGITLLILGIADVIDEFWSGMGSGLIFVGILRLIRVFRYSKDESYREAVNTELNDERNRFIRNKAWAWAGYMFVIISAIAVIVLRLLGQDVLSLAASYAICLMITLYWISFFILRKKY